MFGDVDAELQINFTQIFRQRVDEAVSFGSFISRVAQQVKIKFFLFNKFPVEI